MHRYMCVPYSGDHPNTIQLLGYPHDAIPKMVPREGTTDEGQRVDVGSVAGGRLQAGHPDETRDFPRVLWDGPSNYYCVYTSYLLGI